MLSDIHSTVERARETNRGTDKRLASIVIQTPGDETFDMLSSGEPCHIEMILSRPGVQVLSATLVDGVACSPHAHADSTEYFILITGSLEICGKVYKAGDCAVVPPGTEHAPHAVNGECFVICVLVPPEHQYTPEARL
jgi:mannose-6-phosphate isomerase-like protein (cupin superfamily)